MTRPLPGGARPSRKLDELVDQGGMRYARLLGLDRPAAPLGAPPPSASAKRLGLILLERAERNLGQIFAADPAHSPLGSEMTGARLPYLAPPDHDPTVQRSSLVPLTAACCPDLAERLPYQVAAYEVAAFEAVKEQLAAQISQAFVVEDDLWVRHARLERIPYPFAYTALQYLRKQRAKPGNASLCLRCGCLLYTRTRTTPAVRCAVCAKEPATARDWPAHAVMPHTRGAWWLRCQATGCTAVFQGRRQAHRCDAHRSARISPSRRPALLP